MLTVHGAPMRLPSRLTICNPAWQLRTSAKRLTASRCCSVMPTALRLSSSRVMQAAKPGQSLVSPSPPNAFPCATLQSCCFLLPFVHSCFHNPDLNTNIIPFIEALTGIHSVWQCSAATAVQVLPKRWQHQLLYIVYFCGRVRQHGLK